MSDINSELNHLQSGHPLFYKSAQAVISIQGPDARDFLQRMSTNDLAKLTKDHPLATSFTNNKGGMIDHCLIFADEPANFVLVSSHCHAQTLIDWIEQYHFVEDFVVADLSQQSTAYFVVTTNTQNYAKAAQYWQGILGDLAVKFYISFNPPENALPIDKNSFETFRVAALMPASPQEINASYMPQNINLQAFIAENKGCYVGQEVIAKARIYQKRVKTLCGASFCLEDYARLSPHLKVMSTDHQSGTVTSIAPHFLADLANALVIMENAKEIQASCLTRAKLATIR